MNFELNLSIEELEKRTNKDYLIRKQMLTEDSEEYKNLNIQDKNPNSSNGFNPFAPSSEDNTNDSKSEKFVK